MKPLSPLKLHGVNGARGLTLVGFGVVASLFGIAFFGGEWLGEYRVWPPPPQGLVSLDTLFGLRLWGLAWIIVAIYLFVSSQKKDPSMAMGAFAFMCWVWGMSYGMAFVSGVLADSPSGGWLASSLFFGLLVAVIGVARLVNAPPIAVDKLREMLDDLEGKES